MTWRPLQRANAILPYEVVRAGSDASPQEAFRAMVDSVRQIDLKRPRVLLDVGYLDFATSLGSYVDVVTGMVIRTSDDIATPTGIGAAWQLRMDARIAELDVRVRVYDTSGTLVQTLTANNTSATFSIEQDSATIALASDTTYRVDVDARLDGTLTGYLTHLRLVEQSL